MFLVVVLSMLSAPVFFMVASLPTKIALKKLRAIVQRDCIFEVEADIRSLGALSLPMYEKGMSAEEKAIEVQHDVNTMMEHFRKLSTRTLRFLVRSFSEAPKNTPDTIMAVLPAWFFNETDHSTINANTVNAVVFRNVGLGRNSERTNMIERLRAADEVFNRSTLENLSAEDKAWAERILEFLTFSRDTYSPVQPAIVEFLRDNPDGLDHMVDYSNERRIRINEIDIPTLRNYLNPDSMPLRDGML